MLNLLQANGLPLTLATPGTRQVEKRVAPLLLQTRKDHYVLPLRPTVK
ncbi:hypothetical protein [Acidovorax sp. ACV01]|nr:hypothetical protein [Acidovorax sp. ACV01]MBD9392809.1 hypothetical protein [Acidovorax sp. ACV01]